MSKRISFMVVVLLLIVALAIPGSALAAKKDKDKGGEKSKGSASKPAGTRGERYFEAGVDLGMPVYGFLQLGKMTIKTDDGDQEMDFSGNGTFSFPYFGAHFTLWPSDTLGIQFSLGYHRQTGTAEFSSDDNEKVDGQEFDWSINAFHLDAALFKTFAASGVIRPKIGGGLAIWYLNFSDIDSDEDESYTGWTVGPFGLLGVDFDVYRTRPFDIFASVNLRTDIIYSLAPMEYSGDADAEARMLYWPFTIYASGGIRF